MEESLRAFRECLGVKERDAAEFSPLQLAYIGDAVYELIIRSFVMREGNMPVEKLHRHTTRIVKAQAQAAMYHSLEDVLTDEEKGIFRRGRNAKSYSRAKNASLSEYRIATGFEALVGWLFLKGEAARLAELTAEGLTRTGEWVRKEEQEENR